MRYVCIRDALFIRFLSAIFSHFLVFLEDFCSSDSEWILLLNFSTKFLAPYNTETTRFCIFTDAMYQAKIMVKFFKNTRFHIWETSYHYLYVTMYDKFRLLSLKAN